MTTAAKIFVILLVLFSVAFSMVTVTFVVQQNNWKLLANDYKSAYQAARVEATSVEALYKTTSVQLQSQLSQYAAQMEQLQLKLANAETQLQAKDTELTQLKSDRETALGDAKRAQQLQELDKNRADRSEKRNGELLAETTELQKRNLDLNGRVQELTQQVAILDEQTRALKEQRYALEQQLARAGKPSAAGVPALDTEGQLAQAIVPAAAKPVKIEGRVLDVKGGIASISVGSADGVAEGMAFVVYRGPKYLGKLRVTAVEPNRSGGDLTLVQGEIRPNDSVRDERSFGVGD
ncbi:MAG: hypothetical protein JXQ73_26325 [Phycisphaerae bacterium]|nr:hypothetical protein [Phycisphaerae bacterium]